MPASHSTTSQSIMLSGRKQPRPEKWDCVTPPTTHKPILAIIGAQAFGENILLIRFANNLKPDFARLIFIGPKTLCPVLETALYIDQAYSFEDSIEPVDYYIDLYELVQKRHNTMVPGPYISSRDKTMLKWQHKMNKIEPTRMRIGLVWQGDNSRPGDKTRSTDLSTFKTLLARDDCYFFSLQVSKKKPQPDIEQTLQPAYIDHQNWLDLAPELINFEETAGALSALDLLISTDTATPHLAGALDVPVWLLMPSDMIDWRWKMDKPQQDQTIYETMWYRSMTIFRQDQAHSWDNVIEAMNLHLNYINRFYQH